MQKKNQDCILSKQTMNKTSICQLEQMGGGNNCLSFNEIEDRAGLEALSCSSDEPKLWFVLRDLTRSNASLPAYKLMETLGVTYYTPMHWVLMSRGGRKRREYVPFIHDLLFVHETRGKMDAIVS